MPGLIPVYGLPETVHARKEYDFQITNHNYVLADLIGQKQGKKLDIFGAWDAVSDFKLFGLSGVSPGIFQVKRIYVDKLRSP